MSESEGFDTERERARELLAAEDLTALHLGVVHDDDTVDTVVSRRTDGSYDEGLQALSLLATHLRAVASEAGVEYETVAADAAAVAAQLEELPVETDGTAEVDPHVDDE
jgi:predicted kinase